MFGRNDKYYSVVKIILVITTALLACATVFLFAYCMGMSFMHKEMELEWIGYGFIALFGGCISTMLFYFIGMFFLSISYDIKAIRDKVYNNKDSAFSCDEE